MSPAEASGPPATTLAERYRAHPGAVRRVVAWFVLAGLLAILGFGAPDRLHSEFSGVPDTASAAATDLQQRAFGATSPLLVVLTGPPAVVKREGPGVAAALQSVPSVSVLSPWQPGASPKLRPRPGEALLLLEVHGPYERATVKTDSELRRTLDAVARPPLRAHMTGYIDISNGVHSQLISALRTAEIVSIPMLMVVLVLLLGTPVAAAIPGILGGTLLAASAGTLDLINRVTPLDATALSLAAGISLALGVDYSLLVLARYREERSRGLGDKLALATAVSTAGRTVRFAGLMVAGAMIVAFLLSPGKVLASATAGSVVAVVLSLIAATLVLPSVVLVADPWLERWRVTPGLAGSRAWGRMARRVVQRPGAYFALAGLLLLPLAALSATLKSGPPSGRTLTPSSPERRDAEVISRILGEGWEAPFEVLVQARSGTIAQRPTLLAISRFAKKVGSMPSVQTVLGPDPLLQRTSQLERAPALLAGGASAARRAQTGLARLYDGSAMAARGSDSLTNGLQQAAGGAGSLLSGSGAAQSGAGRLRAGVERASGGTVALRSGIRQLRQGTASLVAGAEALAAGAARLHAGSALAAQRTRAGLGAVRALEGRLSAASGGLDQLRQPVRVATGALGDARAALDGMLPTSKLDPQYGAASQKVSVALAALTGVDPRTGGPLIAGYHGLDRALADASAEAGHGLERVRAMVAQLASLSSGLDRLAGGSAALVAGSRQLTAGLRRLDGGNTQLDTGSQTLAGGLSALGGGAARLDGGVGALFQGLGQLSGGLQFAAGKSGELGQGIARLQGGVGQALRTARASSGRPGDVDVLTRVLRSGYSTLAALSTASPADRRAASFALNLDRGGTTAQVVVIKRGSPQFFAGDPLRRQLENEAGALGRAANAAVAVGGPGPIVEDFDAALSRVVPLLIAVLALLTYVALLVILRAPVLALIAVVLNLVTLAAVVGVLSLAFSGAAPLGGPGYMDDVMLIVILTLVFGLSIDYEVFVLMRMDEAFSSSGDVEEAIVTGVRQTAGVITAAAVILATVFLAFSIGDLVITRELGLGMVVGVLIDATLVRLILLPATIRAIGPRAWWSPRALRRTSASST